MRSRVAIAWEAAKPLAIEEVEVAGPKKGEVLGRESFQSTARSQRLLAQR